MKNILFFFSSTIVGGAETNIYKISKELVNLNYRVSWCYLKNDGPLLNLVDFDLQTSVETGLYYKEPQKFITNFRHVIQEYEIDIVLNFGLRVEIISRLLAKRFGAKRIISNIRSTDNWRKWYHILLDRITSKNIDVWVSNSIAGKMATANREKISLDRIKVIYNFYIPDNIQAQSGNNTDISAIKRIGILANKTKEKGYLDLITISNSLCSKNIRHQIFYAGKDMLNGLFEEQIRKNNLNDCFINCGYVMDKASFFRNFDIFILPSYLEGMPTVVLEAMYYNKFIITTTVGGIPEIIENGRNGILVSPGDTTAMVDAICTLDQGKFNQYIKEGKGRLQKFSKEAIMRQWTNLFEELA